MKSKIKKLIPEFIKKKILKAKRSYDRHLLDELKQEKSKKRIILIGTPEHGNLGDHLIAEGELAFFKDFFNDYKIVEITGDQYRDQHRRVKNQINSKDIITITGGGFLGSLWMREEEMVRHIIKSFYNNKIVILPSTVYFEDNDFGRKELETSKKIYGEHKNLTVCVRDSNSISCTQILLGEKKSNKIIYAPDMALYLNKSKKNDTREGILFCLREDKEKVISDQDTKKLYKIASDKRKPIKKISTVASVNIKKANRAKELQNLFDEFGRSKLTITDRLHGMIFAAITGTPCIALNNCSGKVQGVYSWIKHLKFIVFIERVDEVSMYIDNLEKIKNATYNNDVLIPDFEKIAKALKNEDFLSV